MPVENKNEEKGGDQHYRMEDQQKESLNKEQGHRLSTRCRQRESSRQSSDGRCKQFDRAGGSALKPKKACLKRARKRAPVHPRRPVSSEGLQAGVDTAT